MEIGTVRQVDIDQEMQVAYLDYAMSVIVARALPDVRDGLKPVHRRILYAMYDMALHPNTPYKKSARIVGEVLGKYHPHGDAAVYESMVRMAQDFSMRYMLVDGQGNFGSIDGDSAAAMRYTEARLQALSEEMLADINKETVDFSPNFDGSLREPLVLPSALPNLVVNGSSGIAVGMATNIPPHNLSEVCDALTYLLDQYHRVDDISVDELMQFIQGPDFPTGGIVYTGSENGGEEDHIRNAYAVGRGAITVQAKAHIEEMSRNRSRIVVTELPYQVNKSRLIERIAELVRDGRLEGLTDLRDESDRQGMRIVIELTRNVEPRQMLSELFRLTPMRSTFGIILLALVDGEPRTLSLRRMLYHYVEHRREIITRRSQYDLARARARAHILEGLLVALANLDEVISIIRRSQNAETAHTNLRRRFKLSDLQAQAILDMPLRRLAALERQKIEAEYKEKLQLIARLEDILAHPAKILGLIKGELAELKKQFGDARRTQIVRGSSSEMIMAAPLPDEGHVIVFESSGQVRREPEQQRYLLALGQGDQLPRHLILANARDTLACLTADGRAFAIAAQNVPHIDGQEKKKVSDLSHVNRGDEVAWVLPLPSSDAAPEEGAQDALGQTFLVTVTAAGKIKRSSVADVTKALGRGEALIMNVDPEDRLMWADLSSGGQELILVSAQGKAIRFNEDEVRASGLGAGGVLAVKMESDDQLVGAGLVEDGALLLTVTQQGFGKTSPLKDYPAQKRYGSGIVAARVSDRTGPLVTAAVVRPEDQVILVTGQGTARRVKASALPATGRDSLGRALVEVSPRETVVRGVFLVGQPTSQELPEEAAPRKPSSVGAVQKARKLPATKETKETPLELELPVSKRAAKKVGQPAAKAPTKPSKAEEPFELDLPMSKRGAPAAKTPAKGAAKIAEQPAAKAPTKPSKAKEPFELDLPVSKRGAPAARTPAKGTAPKVGQPPAKAPTKPSKAEEPFELDLPVTQKTTGRTKPAVRKAVVKTEEPPAMELPVSRRKSSIQFPLPLGEQQESFPMDKSPAEIPAAQAPTPKTAPVAGKKPTGKGQTTSSGKKKPQRVSSVKAK